MVWKILSVLFLVLFLGACATTEAENIVSEEWVEAEVAGFPMVPPWAGGHYVRLKYNGVEGDIDIAANEMPLQEAGTVKACLVGFATPLKDVLRYELRRACSSDSLKGGFMSPFLFG